MQSHALTDVYYIYITLYWNINLFVNMFLSKPYVKSSILKYFHHLIKLWMDVLI